MTALRADVDATLRAMPEAQALRRVAIRETDKFANTVDRIACSPFASALRVVLLLEVAYRALAAAASVTATAHVPAGAVRAVSPHPVLAHRLLAIGQAWQDRCAACGRPYGRTGFVHCCAPGRCAPITGWEPRLTPGLDGRSDWDG